MCPVHFVTYVSGPLKILPLNNLSDVLFLRFCFDLWANVDQIKAKAHSLGRSGHELPPAG